MPISLNAFSGKVSIEAQHHHCIQDCIIDGYSIVPHNDAMRVALLGGAQCPPFMLPDIFNPESFLRVGVQYFTQDVLRILGKVLGYFVLS